MKERKEYSDIEMLECIYECRTSTVALCGTKCPFINDVPCSSAVTNWLKSYIQKLKMQEDDLK